MSYSRRLVLVAIIAIVVPADARASGRRAGIHDHRPVILGSRLRGNDQTGATARAFANLTMSNSPSRSRSALLRPGFAFWLRSPPIEGWAERRETFGCVRGTRWTRRNAACHALARRLASHDAGRSPLGAPPWRFWAPGAALPSPNTRLRRSFGRHPDRSQRAPRSQVVVPGGRGPCLPRRRLQAAAAGRHSPLRLQDASGDAPQRARMRIL
jgi:hypothetical protein